MIRLILFTLLRVIIIAAAIYLLILILRAISRLFQLWMLRKEYFIKKPPKSIEHYRDVKDAKFTEIKSDKTENEKKEN